MSSFSAAEILSLAAFCIGGPDDCPDPTGIKCSSSKNHPDGRVTLNVFCDAPVLASPVCQMCQYRDGHIHPQEFGRRHSHPAN